MMRWTTSVHSSHCLLNYTAASAADSAAVNKTEHSKMQSIFKLHEKKTRIAIMLHSFFCEQYGLAAWLFVNWMMLFLQKEKPIKHEYSTCYGPHLMNQSNDITDRRIQRIEISSLGWNHFLFSLNSKRGKHKKKENWLLASDKEMFCTIFILFLETETKTGAHTHRAKG